MSANLRHCAENADLAIPHFIQVVSSICFVGIVESQITGIALGKIAFVFKTRYYLCTLQKNSTHITRKDYYRSISVLTWLQKYNMGRDID
jgi:hypothetical protein